jgi:hypothetical protein
MGHSPFAFCFVRLMKNFSANVVLLVAIFSAF